MDEVKEKPHYLGHRQRLRERFLNGSSDSLPDYELLEMVLFAARSRGDVKPLAKKLLARFGSFSAVITAEPERLQEVDGMGEAAIASIKCVEAAAQRMLKSQTMEQPVLSNWRALLDYCTAAMQHKKREEFRVLFLNKKNRLIADEVLQQGTIDHTPVYPREVVRRALELSASAIILAHNHPSGDPTPSQADIDMTQQIIMIAAPLGIKVHDHLIIGGKDHYSFKSYGLI